MLCKRKTHPKEPKRPKSPSVQDDDAPFQLQYRPLSPKPTQVIGGGPCSVDDTVGTDSDASAEYATYATQSYTASADASVLRYPNSGTSANITTYSRLVYFITFIKHIIAIGSKM